MSQLYECEYVGSPMEAMLTYLSVQNGKRTQKKGHGNIRFRPSDAAWALKNGEDSKGKGNRGCRRRLAYTYYGLPRDPIAPDHLLRMESGSWAHDQLRALWAKAGVTVSGWDPETKKEHLWEKKLKVTGPGGHEYEFPMRGKADGIDIRPCPPGRESNLVEIKTGGDGMMAAQWADGIAPLLAYAEVNLAAIELQKEWIYFAYFRQGEAYFQYWAQPSLEIYSEVIEGFRDAAEQSLKGKITSERGFGVNKVKKHKTCTGPKSLVDSDGNLIQNTSAIGSAFPHDDDYSFS